RRAGGRQLRRLRGRRGAPSRGACGGNHPHPGYARVRRREGRSAAGGRRDAADHPRGSGGSARQPRSEQRQRAGLGTERLRAGDRKVPRRKNGPEHDARRTAQVVPSLPPKALDPRIDLLNGKCTADKLRGRGEFSLRTTRMVELLPSILSADFARLAEEVAAAERGGGTVIHVDVMDGHFVPNITIGPPVVQSLRKATRLPLDCHLMIENPDEFIPAFAAAGANWVSVHYEACRHLHRSLELIAQHGMKPGVVL